MVGAVSGEQRIATAFARASAEGRAALVIYLTAGWPAVGETARLVPALERAGADLVELGVPFSDPIADGPIIQRASYHALCRGVTPRRCLELAARLRADGVALPLVLMGYYNPILAWGPSAYAAACRSAGVDGLIVPDLPPEEAGELDGALRTVGLALIPLVAPNTPEARLARIAGQARGFLYLVSRPGTTGPRGSLPAGLRAYVARARRASRLPLALGFGISSPSQVRQVARLVDGVVVGSAVVERAALGAEAVEGFVRELRGAVGRGG
ncbi:MAG: tryptophan synthase subunit alpha [Anaerolineae bacterium]|nr:tryptophan synthase subunit alpha [Anaerolineae bacterium]